MSTIFDSKNHLKLDAPLFISKQKMNSNPKPQIPDKVTPTQEIDLNKNIIKKKIYF